MLSLVLGSEITDSLVATIASTYSKLELLDLSWVESNLHQLNCRCLNSWTVVMYFLSPNRENEEIYSVSTTAWGGVWGFKFRA